MKKLITILLSAIILNVCPILAEENLQTNEYDDVTAVEDGKAYIYRTNSEDDNKNMNWVADKDGNIVFGPLAGYIQSTDSVEQYIYSDENKNFSLLDGKGNVITNFSEKYENIGWISKIKGHDIYSISVAPDKESFKYKNGIIDINGNIILPLEYNIIESEFKNGLLSISKEIPNNNLYKYKYGFIDENYKIVIPVEYDGSIMFSDMAYFYKENGEHIDYYKFENNTSVFYKTIDFLCSPISENECEYVNLYKNKTEENKGIGCFGFADKNLNIIIEPKYDTPIIFNGNYAIVQYGSTESEYIKGIGDVYNGKFGIIDKNGKEIIKPEYDRIIDKNNGRFVLFKDAKKEIISLDKEIKNIDCNNWAKDSIIYGEWSDIIPNAINSDFTKNITRGEFCTLAVQTFLKCKGDWKVDDYCRIYEIDLYSNPFNDTTDKNIIFANKLGIVSGKGNGKFVPNDTITRQEAAVMIVNMATALDYTLNADKSNRFSDENYFADWAKENIYKVITFKGSSNVPVMAGTGENKFSPWFNYSREQAIATMVRIYDIYQLQF